MHSNGGRFAALADDLSGYSSISFNKLEDNDEDCFWLYRNIFIENMKSF
jgi:hypothetical protein